MSKQTYQTCQNCGTPLQGDYCHRCGQRANEPRRAVIGLVQDVFVDTLWVDGRLLRSIGLLLWRPGRLARRYLDGRRQHYTPPFRMYLFASVFYFFFLFWMAGTIGQHAGDDFWKGLEDGMADETDAGPEEIRIPGIPGSRIVVGDRDEQEPQEEEPDQPQPAEEAAPEAPDAPAAPQEEEEEEAAADDDGATRPPWQLIDDDTEFEDVTYNGPAWFEPHARKFFYGLKRIGNEPRLFIASVQANLPRVMLLAPLFYALILSLFYFYRRKFYFYDHLVISLYMHGALYAYLLIAMVIEPVPFLNWLTVPLMIWALLQPFAVLRQAYGSNWISVLGKGVLTMGIYNFLMFVLIVFGLSYSIYQA